ncbi:MAG: hypothetical protein Q8J84_08470 [Flavobacteriaceae bacterium]|nr:hypothetical protein [Flavobacteriaceae bacterium]
MKKIITILLIFSSLAVFSQAKGKVSGTIFFNYHNDLTEGALQKSAFEIERVYLGYDYIYNEKWSAKVLLDVGKDNGSDYTFFLKAAQVDYKALDWAKFSAGMIGLNQLSDQEKTWGYRYIYKSFQDIHGFGTTADVGLNSELKLHNTLKMNLFVLNGEGYKKVQDLYGKYKVGGNLIYHPTEALIFKVYYAEQDSKKLVGTTIVENPTVKNIALFAGYEKEKVRFGAEYNKMYDAKKFTEAELDHDLNGFSIYSTYVLNEKFEFFGRYDLLESNKIGTSTANWNADKDGNAILFGAQYTPIKGVKSSLNYRVWDYNLATKNDLSMLYLNLEVKF